jgi:hypothetical protein
MQLQILRIWAKGRPGQQDVAEVEAALLRDAQNIFNPLTFKICGEVNLKEQGPLPNAIGFTEAQDYVDANTANGQALAKVRDYYLDASHLLGKPVYVLFVVPAGELKNANGFSLLSGYCSVLPVPTGVEGTADGHTYAHEIAHGLSLEHVEDSNNLMYPYRRIPNKGLSGDTLTVDQKKDMRGFLSKNPSLVS